MLDMVTSKPIDLLADRTTDTVADWLKKHPGAEVVCRDHAGAYAEGIRIGAPDAVQVADRWHLWHNLAEAVEKTVTRHRADLRLPVEDAEDVDVVTAGIDEYARAASEPIDGRLVTRTRERHTAVRQLASQGLSISAIGRKLSLDRSTVRRFARATEVEELLTKGGIPRQPARRVWGPTSTNASTPGAPMPPDSLVRSPCWATAAATRLSAATCSRCGAPAIRFNRDPLRRRFGRPQAG
jgi:hypothetical protein